MDICSKCGIELNYENTYNVSSYEQEYCDECQLTEWEQERKEQYREYKRSVL